MLTKDDYKVILAVLDAGSQKGLFRPADFATVGGLYGKIQMLLEAPQDTNVPTSTATTTLNTNT